MKFITLKDKDIDMELISAAVRDYGMCDLVDNYEELINTLREGLSRGENYGAIFLKPKDGFLILKQIRDTERLTTNTKNKIQVIFLSEDKNSIFFLEKMTTSNESFISKNIIKREIVEKLIECKIIS